MKTSKLNLLIKDIFIKHGLINTHAKICSDAIINAELVGKPTFSNWGVKYYNEELLRHPSQLYEAFFEGLVIFLIMIFFFHLIPRNLHIFLCKSYISKC